MLSPAKVLGNILFVVWLFAAFWWHHLVSALLSMTVDVSVFVYTQSCDISCNAFLCRSLLLVMQMPMKKESHLIQLAAVVHRWVLFLISEGRGGESGPRVSRGIFKAGGWQKRNMIRVGRILQSPSPELYYPELHSNNWGHWYDGARESFMWILYFRYGICSLAV